MSRQSTIGKLSEVAARQAKGKERAYKLSDGGGLYLLVNPNGTKYWRLKYRLNGKEKTLALGVYPGVSMAEARAEAVKGKEFHRQGIDPVIRRKQEKVSNAKNTFRNIAKEWYDKQKGRWVETHADQVWLSLKNDVFPLIGDISIKDIQTLDCLSVIRAIEKRGALDVAGRVKQRIRSVFRYAIQTARCEYNPADQLQGVIETRRVTHRAALKAEALPAFLDALDAYPGHIGTRLALKLLIHTFVRPGEIRGALWQEFDLEKREWRIPAERMKMKEEHIVKIIDFLPATADDVKVVLQGYHMSLPKKDIEAIVGAVKDFV